MIKKYFLSFLFLSCSLFFFAQKTLAVRYSLVPPSGTLERGNNYDFIINIDTQGSSITNATIGMSYDAQYLEYVTTTNGETMTSVSTSQIENGKLILTGTNTNGFSGTGVFAKVTFKLIAGAPGETELCVLWNPQNQPTSTPRPTALPTTGATNKTIIGTVLGMMLIAAFGSFYFLINKN